jgi:hypothetical protein
MSKMDEMKKYAADNRDNIQLRSEKVRNIIGELPPFLIRWGNTILTLIFALLILAAWYFGLIPWGK